MPRKKTLQDFIEEASKIHGDKYDYSETDYKGSHTKVSVICPKHGEFLVTPTNHLEGRGCPKCSFTRTTEEFIRKAREVFGAKYDYSRSHFVNAHEKLVVSCPEHGEFLTTPNNHLSGHGCPICSKNKKYTTQLFIDAARRTHGDIYDYSGTVYVNAKTNVKIICPKHGEFWQKPSNHLKGTRCPHCGAEIGGKKISSNTEEFLKKAIAIHGYRYDFSKAHYTKASNKITIICPEHGEFQATPQNILAGHGCPKCAGNSPLNTEEFIRRANEVHDGIYDYSKTKYVNYNEKVCIICHRRGRNGKEHGEFWQHPGSHLKGVGCPKCKSSHLEKQVRSFLGNCGLFFEEQKTFEWLTDDGHMWLDFFIPDYGVAIECQGSQHFEAYDVWGGIEGLRNIQRRDSLKKRKCNEHGIEVIYFSNLKRKFPYLVLGNLKHLLETIKERGVVDPTRWKDPELPFIFE